VTDPVRREVRVVVGFARWIFLAVVAVLAALGPTAAMASASEGTRAASDELAIVGVAAQDGSHLYDASPEARGSDLPSRLPPRSACSVESGRYPPRRPLRPRCDYDFALAKCCHKHMGADQAGLVQDPAAQQVR
jgi:hypothetical protein